MACGGRRGVEIDVTGLAFFFLFFLLLLFLLFLIMKGVIIMFWGCFFVFFLKGPKVSVVNVQYLKKLKAIQTFTPV